MTWLTALPSSRCAGFGRPLLGQVPGLDDVVEHVEAVAGARGAVQARHVDRRGRAGLLVLLPRIQRVVHRLDPPEGAAADDHVAEAERALAHQQLGHHAAALVQLGLQAGAGGGPVGIGLVVVQFGHGQQGFQQLVDALAGGRAGLDHFRLAAPFAGEQLVCGQLLRRSAVVLSPGRSILFSATTIGTSAARAWLIASSVCGITPSSAATTSTAMSVTLAPRARISVKASWPGVSTKATARPSASTR